MKRNILISAVIIAVFAVLYLSVTFLFENDETMLNAPFERLADSPREIQTGKTDSPPSSIGHEKSVPRTSKVPEEADKTKASETNSKPDTTIDLGLKLRGIIASDESDPENLLAVIETIRSGEQNLYRIGDRILDATIIGINQDMVVLEVNGFEKILTIEGKSVAQTENKLPDPEFSYATAPGPQDKTAEKTPDQEVASAQENEKSETSRPSIGKTKFGNQPDSVVITPGKPIPLKISRINDAFTDLETLVKEVRIKEVYNEEEPEGFILSNIEPTSILKQIGLRIGDMVTGINGQKISTVDQALSFYEGLSPGDRISIQLKRRGRPTTIEYIIEE